MVGMDDIERLISDITYDLNLEKIKRVFGSTSYTDESKQSILHIMVDNEYDD